MQIEVLTREDMKIFKMELLEEIRKLLPSPSEKSEWLKSADVRQLLRCSAGTLQHLRINGTLPFTKIGGTIYYAYNDVAKLLHNKK